MVKYSMDSSSSHQSEEPERLKTLACGVKFSGGNTLLHQFVLDNSDPKNSGGEHYINAVLLSMADVPGKVVNALNSDGYSALHLAVLKQNLMLVKKLLSCLRNIDVDGELLPRAAYLMRSGGHTALHLAAELGNVSIIQELLKKGANIDIYDRRRNTAIYLAMMSGHAEAVKLLVSEGANVKPMCGCNPVHEAARSGRLDMLKILLRGNRADINAKIWWDSRDTPLHEAVLGKNLECVAFLIDQGADLDCRDDSGSTPLHRAVEHKSLEIAKLLIDGGADLNAADDADRTPLLLVSQVGILKSAEFLIDQGADPNAANTYGWNPLHYAAWYGHVDLVRWLLDKGFNVNVRNGSGQTPLDLARFSRKQACIDVLQNVKNPPTSFLTPYTYDRTKMNFFPAYFHD